MSTSKIEWTDRTWNPVRGCTKISPGCKNCYAETFAERWRGVPGHPYEQGFDLRLVPENLDAPLHWKKPCRIFVNSMSDLFQEGVPMEFIANVFGVMAVASHVFWSGGRTMRVGTRYEQGKQPEPLRSFGSKYGPHVFQVLTKRPERMKALLCDRRFRIEVSRHAYMAAHDRIDAGYLMERIHDGRLWPLPGVHLGVSVEDRKNKDRIEILRDTPASVRFLSIEPILEDIGTLDLTGIHWVIIGSESGNKARDYDTAWFESIIRQCEEAGVACFVKQITLRGRKILFEQWPGYLQVRQFPEVSR